MNHTRRRLVRLVFLLLVFCVSHFLIPAQQVRSRATLQRSPAVDGVSVLRTVPDPFDSGKITGPPFPSMPQQPVAPHSVAGDAAGYILTMESAFQWTDLGETPPATAEMSAVSAVALPFEGDALLSSNTFSGHDVITLTQFTVMNGGIQCTKSGALGTFSASGEVADDTPTEIRLLILADTYVSCPLLGNIYNTWFSALYGMHEDEIQGQDWEEGFVVDGWTAGPTSDIVLQKVYDRTRTFDTDLQITELTTFSLWRMPSLPEVGEIEARGLHTPGEQPETGREVYVWADVAASSDYELHACVWNGDLVAGQGNPDNSCAYTYTPVPDHGPAQDTYGDKDVYLTLLFKHKATGALVWTQVEGEYQVYFAKHGLDQGVDGDPNWFTYWADDGAVPGLDESDVFYDPSLDGYGAHDDGEILIGPRASEVHYDPPLVVTATTVCPGGTFGGAQGIDAVAEVLVHERRHEAIDEQWRHIGTNTCADAEGAWGDCTDGDGDQLPDDYEQGFGTSPHQSDSCDLAGLKDVASYAADGDQELDAITAGDGALGSSADDWANPGMQSSPLAPVASNTHAGMVPLSSESPIGVDETQLANTAASTVASLTGVYADQWLDDDGDGLYEGLEITVGISVAASSSYNVVAWLEDSAATPVTWAASADVLPTGMQTVSLVFDGPAIRRSGLDGPYTVAEVALQTGDSVRTIDQASGVHTTTAVLHTDLTPPAAVLTGYVNDTTLPLPGDPSRMGPLRLDVGLALREPGTYTVGSTLVAGATRIGTRGRALTAPTGSYTLTLIFPREQLFGHRVDGPYALQNLRVLDGNGNLLDTLASAYTTTAGYTAAQFRYGGAYVDVDAITDQGVDTNGNGRFDRLEVSVPITVTEIDTYRVTAILEDSAGDRIDTASQLLAGAPAVHSATQQTVPTAQSVILAFDGDVITAHGADGPYTVASLAIQQHTGAHVDELPVAHTTAAYDLTDFPASLDRRVYLPLILK